MNIHATLSALALVSLFTLATPGGADAQEGPQPVPPAAISGFTTAPNGNLLVSPPPGGPSTVNEVSP
ncbi:MAG TPA: hypothetical protein VMV18_12020, partial [bacterium]|nr:hypothetical protein [bacterium]